MSKLGAKGKAIKKVLQKIDHSSRLRVIIPAGMATAKPPLGSQLGQVKEIPNILYKQMYM